jgi:hypothetical protein
MNYNLILESLLYLSPNFREILSEIDHPIAEELIDLEGSNLNSDISFIDINKEGTITFSQMNNAKRRIEKYTDEESYIDTDFLKDDNDIFYTLDFKDDGPGIYNKSRNEIKIGKLINSVFPNKYKDKEVESFVNLLKVKFQDSYTFEIVNGREIREAYKTNNYLKVTNSIGNSCMNDKNFLDLYEINADVCRLLILKKDGKIAGRSLLWELDKIEHDGQKIDTKFFLDRIYICEDFLISKFQKYATENNWAYRLYQGYYEKDEIVFKKIKYKGVQMTVKIQKGTYKNYPYMDTFTRLNVKKGILYNDSNRRETGHILSSLEGSYSYKNYPKQKLYKTIIKKFRDFLEL